MQIFFKLLNNYKNHIEQSTLHFKRWSNTNYAVFNSIGKVVHIGKLSQIIHGLVTVKSVLYHGFIKLFYSIDQHEKDADGFLEQLEVCSLLESGQLPLDFIVIPSTDSSRDLYIANNFIFINFIFEAFNGPFFLLDSHFLKKFQHFFYVKNYSS